MGWTIAIQNLTECNCNLNGRSFNFGIIWVRFRNWRYNLRVFAGGRLNLSTSESIWLGIWTFIWVYYLTLGLKRAVVEVELVFTTWKLFLCYVCFDFCTLKIAFVGVSLDFRTYDFCKDYVFGFRILGHEESISGNKVVYRSRDSFS